MINPSAHEAHDLPLADRLVEAEIRQWLDARFATALATRGDHGTELAERKAIEEVQHLHLADFYYTVVPRILGALQRAGLLRQTGGSNG